MTSSSKILGPIALASTLLFAKSLSAVTYVNYEFGGYFVAGYRGPTINGPVENQTLPYSGNLSFALHCRESNELERLEVATTAELRIGEDDEPALKQYYFNDTGPLNEDILTVTGGEFDTAVTFSPYNFYDKHPPSPFELLFVLHKIEYVDFTLYNQAGLQDPNEPYPIGSQPIDALADSFVVFSTPVVYTEGGICKIPDSKTGWTLVPLILALAVSRRRKDSR